MQIHEKWKSDHHNNPRLSGCVSLDSFFISGQCRAKISSNPQVGGPPIDCHNISVKAAAGKRSEPRPPLRGWKVPYDGPVDDSFVIGAASTALVPSIQNPVPVTQVRGGGVEVELLVDVR